MLVTIFFAHSVNLDRARVQIQNRVNLALPTLPEAVKQAGVRVKQKPARRPATPASAASES